MNDGSYNSDPSYSPYPSQTDYTLNAYGSNQYGQHDGEAMMDGYYDDGTVEKGSYYPLMAPYKPLHFQSCPIGSLAIDPVADSMYIAGHTTLLSRRRHHIGYPSSIEQRASMLVTQSFSSGALYAACAAHTEARHEVLNNIASSIYGNAFKNSTMNKTQIKIPSHAYRPPYDPVDFVSSQLAPFPKQHHHGVTKILPFASKHSSGSNAANDQKMEGYHCSISPSAVRVHTRGGLQVSSSQFEGMVCGTFHPGTCEFGVDEKSICTSVTNVTVGGVSTNRSGTNLHFLDLYTSSLKTVASHAVKAENGIKKMCISDIATNYQTTNIIAGCSDGTLRIFDGSWRSGKCMEIAKVKAHSGGVAHVASSGNLICTTGFSSRSPTNYASRASTLYAFPDEHVLVFDIRYLGRGGIVHPFSGLKGGPRFVEFIPGLDGNDGGPRILVCSGQAGGGVQIIKPFDSFSASRPGSSDFFNLPLEGTESITAISSVGMNMAMGTSSGNILQFRMQGYNQIISDMGKTESALTEESLVVPSYLDVPQLSIDPNLLRDSVSHNAPSISIFNPYIMCAEPMITPTEDGYSFGPLHDTFLPASKTQISIALQQLMSRTKPSDYMANIQATKLGLNLIKINATGKASQEIMNANKLLYGKDFANICYNTDADPRKKDQRGKDRDNVAKSVPERYRSKDRPLATMFKEFDFAALNDTLFPGYDYPPSMSNSSLIPALLLLYFVPEIQNAMLFSQSFGAASETRKKGVKSTLLSEELGFLFHQINSISSHAMCHPKPPGAKEVPYKPVLDTFVPSNFLSAFVMMPESSALALLDNSPAATEIARRPEAFYRFLLHHLDRELNSGDESAKNKRQSNKKDSKTKKTKLIDSLQGLDAVSMNEFITGSGPPSASSTRSYTIDLSYEAFVNGSEESRPDFRQLLQYSLSKHVRLRAWCETSKKFETVVQRKIITSLPTILSLSCACAGVHGEDRLPIWRKTSGDHPHWLPEMIEIAIDDCGNVITRELVKKYESSEPRWEEFKGNPLPDSVVATLREVSNTDASTGTRCARYRLDTVLTYLNDKANEDSESNCGRHCVHTRIPKSYKQQILRSQLRNLKRCAADMDRVSKLTLLRDLTPDDFDKRMDYVEEQIKQLDENTEDEWILFNGANVTSTNVDDALAFHVPFKEPCLLVYRQMNSESEFIAVGSKVEIPNSIWTDSSLQPNLPKEGDALAFDAEFVQVENETTSLTATGSKIVSVRGRNAVGRISLLDSDTNNELIDDHVIPREPVVDYLTRFSGITPSDLNPKTSKHNLISARNAYLKMRYLADRGCKFVGHGLRQDFLTVNLFVPPCQIIDTVDIFREENRRYISLRFLVNYLLGRDMQIEIHDSVEDSRAANELYLKACELKEKGIFEETLRKIYERGQQIDWKVAEIKL